MDTRYSKEEAASPPAPITSTLEFRSFFCPSIPISFKKVVWKYLSRFISSTASYIDEFNTITIMEIGIIKNMSFIELFVH